MDACELQLILLQPAGHRLLPTGQPAGGQRLTLGQRAGMVAVSQLDKHRLARRLAVPGHPEHNGRVDVAPHRPRRHAARSANRRLVLAGLPAPHDLAYLHHLDLQKRHADLLMGRLHPLGRRFLGLGITLAIPASLRRSRPASPWRSSPRAGH